MPNPPMKGTFLNYYLIPIGIILLVGGVYYYSYPFRFPKALSDGESVFYLFLGAGGIMCGIGLPLFLYAGLL